MSVREWFYLANMRLRGVNIPTKEDVEAVQDTRYEYRVRKVTTHFGTSYYADCKAHHSYAGWDSITNDAAYNKAFKGGDPSFSLYKMYDRFDDESSATLACHDHAARRVVTTTTINLGKLP